MKRNILTLSAIGLGAFLTASAAWAGSTAIVEQSGNYNLTIVQQKDGGGGRVVSKQIKPRNYTRLTEKFAKKTARSARMQALTGGSFPAGACRGMSAGNKAGANRPGFANTIAVNQHGAAAGWQSGGANTASVAQSGTNNTATMLQSGSSNASFVIQAGDNHTAYTTQTGNNNIAMVTQGC